jgi:peptidyl-prolyl cis-trans isomerase C
MSLVATGFLIACSPDSEQQAAAPADVFGPGEVAVVDGERIPESIFRLYTLTGYQVNADDLTPEGRREFIDEVILLRVLADEAERQGLHEERRLAADLELQRLQLLGRALTERFSAENPPTESELRDLYEANLSRLAATEYRVRHILVESEAEASDIIQQLDQGGDFAALAREHSTDTSTAPDGGDLGWSSADGWVDPFAEAVLDATPGAVVAAPVETQFGWHVILVEDKAEQVAPGLASVRQDLEAAVRNQKLEAYVRELREAAEVTIADD